MRSHRLPGQSANFYVEELDGEFLLFRHGSSKAILLNETAGLIWRLCDGTRSVAAIIDFFAAQYPSAEDIATDVTVTIEQLEKVGAIVSDSSASATG